MIEMFWLLFSIYFTAGLLVYVFYPINYDNLIIEEDNSMTFIVKEYFVVIKSEKAGLIHFNVN
ncbi:MAG: hypothetical protein RIR48_387 [Bacteroidota bacterium]|jgi:hypothetical protein